MASFLLPGSLSPSVLRRVLRPRLRKLLPRGKASNQEPGAYEELVRLAVEADPSLASLAEQHLLKHPSRHLILGPDPRTLPTQNKPPWLRQRGAQGRKYEELKEQLSQLNLSTVCQEAQCPNIGECWNGKTGTATIMIMGDTCTRGCRFCAVSTARTPPPLDPLEPEKTAQAVASWGVGYVVLTSVDRDDLEDGGASHFRRTVEEIKSLRPDLYVECLTPDFSGNLDVVVDLATSGLDVFAHNIETVERLQKRARDRRAGYFQSLAVLKKAKECNVVTKSSIMLGFGETEDEIVDTMLDLRYNGVDILTLGQYLQPTEKHLPVAEFVTPEVFQKWKKFGEESIGFKSPLSKLSHFLEQTLRRYVASGPLVRSSYRAGEVFIESILRQKKLEHV